MFFCLYVPYPPVGVEGAHKTQSLAPGFIPLLLRASQSAARATGLLYQVN